VVAEVMETKASMEAVP